MPSENRPTSGRLTRSPAWTDCIIASESFICTPTTLISGPQRLDVVGNTRDQAAAADGHEDGVEPVRTQAPQLAQHFHRDRALAGDHMGVVEGVDEGQALFLLQPDRMRVGVE